MEISQTRKEILEYLDDYPDAKVIDLETALNKNRSGIIRHLADSEKEGLVTITRTSNKKNSKTTGITITKEGKNAIGRHTDLTDYFKKFFIDNKQCGNILIELLKYPTGFDCQMFTQSVSSQTGVDKNEIINEINKLKKYRIIKQTDGDISVSDFGTVVIIENETFRKAQQNNGNEITREIEGIINPLLSKSGITDISAIGAMNKTLALICNSYEYQNDIIDDFIFNSNKSIDDIVNDDSFYEEIDNLIKIGIVSRATSHLFYGQNLLKKTNPRMLQQFLKQSR